MEEANKELKEMTKEELVEYAGNLKVTNSELLENLDELRLCNKKMHKENAELKEKLDYYVNPDKQYKTVMEEFKDIRRSIDKLIDKLS